jgi:acylphosphatase
MKFVNDHAAFKLFEKVKSLAEEPHDSWRSIHIPLSGKGEYSAGLRRYFIMRPLNELLADMDGYIYVCDDGDIFILFQGKVTAILDLLDDHFGDVKTDPALFSVFDLGRYWEEFFDLCATKAQQAMIPPDPTLRKLAAPEAFAPQ